MHVLALRRLLRETVLASEEFAVGWSSSARHLQSLWSELTAEQRALAIVLLKKAHEHIGLAVISAASGEQLYLLNSRINAILARESALAASAPEFQKYAAVLKDIFLRAIEIRISAPLKRKEQPPLLVLHFKRALRRMVF